MKLYLFGVMATVLASGCASTPDLNVRYYPAKTEVAVSVTRTVGCVKFDGQDELIVASSAVVTPSHSADLSAGPLLFSAHKLDRFWADSSFTVEHYADGRLKGINSSSTGKGEDIILSGLKLGGAVLGIAKTNDYSSFCNAINGAADKRTETATLEFYGVFDPSNDGVAHLPPKKSSLLYFQNLGSVIGSTYVAFNKTTGTQGALIANKSDTVEDGETFGDYVGLQLRQPAVVDFSVFTGSSQYADNAANVPPDEREVVSKGRISVAQRGQKYSIPVPSAAMFGESTFAVSLAESGALTKISYGAKTGVGSILSLGNSIDELYDGSTYAEKAAAEKAKADLIAQQQRLIRCQTDPANCT